MHYRLGTLVYVIRDDGKVLVMHRNKEPNLGLWIAPGGKVEMGESRDVGGNRIDGHKSTSGGPLYRDYGN